LKNRFIKLDKSWVGSVRLTVGGRVSLYAGQTDHWGLGFDFNFWDRSFTLEIIHWYLGVEVWHKE